MAIGKRGRSVRDDSGAAAVEFALVSILLVILIVGMFEIGTLFAAQAALTHAAREGARLAAVHHPFTSADEALVQAQAHAGPLADSTVVVTVTSGLEDPNNPDSDIYVQCDVSSSMTIRLINTSWTQQPQAIPLKASARMRAEF